MVPLRETPFAPIEVAVTATPACVTDGRGLSDRATRQPDIDDTLERACAALADADPTLVVRMEQSSDQVVLGARDEAHLEAAIGTLRRAVSSGIAVGTTRIGYRARLGKPVTVNYSHKAIGHRGPTAQLHVLFEPAAVGTGSTLTTAGDALSNGVTSSIGSGIEDVMRSDPATGYPIIDVTATLIAGSVRGGDMELQSVETAARRTFQTAVRDGGCILHEPIMTIAITIPCEDEEAVIRDFRRRRGHVARETRDKGTCLIEGTVPLATMLGYGTQLRSFGMGTGTVAMAFSHLAEVPHPGPEPFSPAMALRA